MDSAADRKQEGGAKIRSGSPAEHWLKDSIYNLPKSRYQLGYLKRKLTASIAESNQIRLLSLTLTKKGRHCQSPIYGR